jgi:hypothetical protein
LANLTAEQWDRAFRGLPSSSSPKLRKIAANRHSE